jgi:Domain of unknown function (DUF4403)
MIQVRVSFDGSAKGELYFVGTPQYDASTGRLGVSKLDFSLETRNLLLKTADWLLHSDIRAQIMDRLHLELLPLIENARQQVSNAMAYDSADFSASAVLKEFDLRAVSAVPDAKVLRADLRFSGQVATHVK